MRRRSQHRQCAEPSGIEPHRVGSSHPHANRTVIETHVTGTHTKQRATDCATHLLSRKSQAPRFVASNLHRHFGTRLGDAPEEIIEPFDFLNLWRQDAGIRLKGPQVGAEQFDFHRPARTTQVIQHVRKNLNELHTKARYGRRYLTAHLFNHFGDVATALTGRQQSYRDVAPILLRGKQSEFRTSPPRNPGDLRRLHQNLLDGVQLTIRLGERGAAGTPVIENERALIHLRQKSRTDQCVRSNAGRH